MANSPRGACIIVKYVIWDTDRRTVYVVANVDG